MNCPICIRVSMKSFRSLIKLDPQICIFFKNVHSTCSIKRGQNQRNKGQKDQNFTAMDIAETSMCASNFLDESVPHCMQSFPASAFLDHHVKLTIFCILIIIFSPLKHSSVSMINLEIFSILFRDISANCYNGFLQTKATCLVTSRTILN